MVIPPLIGNPYNWYIKPYHKVDDHPLLYGNNGSLDPGTHENYFKSTFQMFHLAEYWGEWILLWRINFTWLTHHLLRGNKQHEKTLMAHLRLADSKKSSCILKYLFPLQTSFEHTTVATCSVGQFKAWDFGSPWDLSFERILHKRKYRGPRYNLDKQIFTSSELNPFIQKKQTQST